jgi:putative adhesin
MDDENVGPAGGQSSDQTPEESAQEHDAQPISGGSVEDSAEGKNIPPPPLVPESESTHSGEQPVADAGETGKSSAQPEPSELVGRIEIAVVSGDFSVRGGSSEVVIDTHGEDTAEVMTHHDNVVRIARLPDGAELWAPDGFEVIVRSVDGDLRGSRFDGLLQVEQVGGDVSTTSVSQLRIAHVSGDLRATRGDDLRVRETSGDVRIEDFTGAPLLGGVRGDLDVRNVQGLEVREGVGGDVHIENCRSVILDGAIGGDLNIERCAGGVFTDAVGGDAKLVDVQEAGIGVVGGDLEIHTINGPLEVNVVSGDSALRRVQGRIRVNVVSGDLSVTHAPGGLLIGQVGGDATLETELGAAEYTVSAGGDITLRTRGEVNARFVAQALGGEVRTRLPLALERGRRRNLVGVLGRGDATVTLRSGGDINIVSTDRYERADSMSDDTQKTGDGQNDSTTKTYEGAFGKHKFRVRVDRGADRAGLYFQGPYTDDETAEDAGAGSRDFGFEWERGHGPRTYGEYEAKLNELRDKAEQVARRASEQASRYAEKAAQKARETDWQAIGREVRSTIERAMGDLEDAFGQMRREWETRKPSDAPSGGSRSSSQRVRIEQDETGDDFGFSGMSQADREAERRAILEQLRTGSISIEDAERRLNGLR